MVMHADGETVRRKLKGDSAANAFAGAGDQYGSHDGVPWLKSVVNSSSLGWKVFTRPVAREILSA